MSRTLVVAQDVADDTLIDAERLAAALLAAAKRQAAIIIAQARREASLAFGDNSLAFGDNDLSRDVFESRHREVLAELAECRRDLHVVVEASRRHRGGSVGSADPPSHGHGLPAALSVKVQGRPLPLPARPSSWPWCPDSNDEFSAALFRAVAGLEPLDPSWWDDSRPPKTATTGPPGRPVPGLRPSRTSPSGVVVTLASRRPG